MQNEEINIQDQWLTELKGELEKPYMANLWRHLRSAESSGATIYPGQEQIFAALNCTPLGNVKVVVLGQDPYHGPEQAHGLSFSVPQGIPIPPSLRNIYKELVTDLGCEYPKHGNLTAWAKQGVLLLNSVLTVEHGVAASHRDLGWEKFTDRIIDIINSRCQHVVFLLWGSYAHKKGRAIHRHQHLVLEAPHPSPLSAYRGFFGCQHFSQANAYLQQHDKKAIDWQIR